MLRRYRDMYGSGSKVTPPCHDIADIPKIVSRKSTCRIPIFSLVASTMTRHLPACAVLAVLLVCAGAAPPIFEATSEFQEIQEGQQVPAGLHYRINLETGKKEAKLIDPNEVRRRDARLLVSRGRQVLPW